MHTIILFDFKKTLAAPSNGTGSNSLINLFFLRSQLKLSGVSDEYVVNY